MKSIGSARFSGYDSLVSWLKAQTIDTGRAFTERVDEKLKELFPDQCLLNNRTDTDVKIIHNTVNEMYCAVVDGLFGMEQDIKDKWQRERWEECVDQTSKRFKRFKDFSEEFGQPFNVGCWNEVFAYVYFGNPAKGIIVPDPDSYLHFEPFPDYSDISLPQLKARMNVEGDIDTSNWLPDNVSSREVTHNQVEKLHQQQLEAKEKLNEIAKQIKNCETKELAAMKAEMETLQANIRKRQTELMLDLETKMDEADVKINQLKAQLFMLDSQIYAIQCFAGEIVNFAHVRVGENAPVTEPVVVYQKLRFLDEELGRMAAIYQIDWDNISMFEDFLRYSPAALETFAPDKRCVTLVRISKTNTRIGRSSKFGYSNMLEYYEYFHGRTVGIIIRNGDNVYIGWTDENRVHIEDDFIISRLVTDVSPVQETQTVFTDELTALRSQRKEREKQFDESMHALSGIVSRAFVFNILQGIVKNTNWLPLPAGESLTKPSPYVRYSLADRCLEDHKYADFDKLVKLANEDVAVGDPLLTMQHLRSEKGQYWHNDRGRGYADRTHDVAARDCVIYKANLVEYDEPEHLVRVKAPSPFGSTEDDKWTVYVTDESRPLQDGAVVLERFDRIKRHVFVSLEKSYSENARANFELYEEEYINLSFMNSVWLTWAINTKNLGNWRVNGIQVFYAHAIHYLNTALDFVRKREEREKAAIDAVDPEICKNPEWPLLLSDWKIMLSKGHEMRSVHNITPFQAKRFVKWVSSGMPGRKNYSKGIEES